jgi:GNAT superfamily N-acetyltransferase
VSSIRPIDDRDRPRLGDLLRASWGSTRMATRGRLVDVSALPGFIAQDAGEWLGYAAFELRGGELEISVLESLVPGRGVGSALLAACVRAAQDAGVRRLWLVTTNDNTTALRFYQRRGFVLAALHRRAADEARRTLKPEMPVAGEHGIRIRDELELELPPADWSQLVERLGWSLG